MVSKPGQRRTLRIAYLGNLASSIRAPARGQGNRQAGQRCLTIDHRCQSSHLAMNKPLNHSRCSCWYHVSTSTSCLFYSVRCHGLRVFPWTCLCMHAHGTVPSASSHIYPRRRIPHPPEPTKKRVSYTRPLPQHSAEHEPGRFHFTCTDTSRPVPLIRGHPASESRSDCSNARNHGIPAAEVLPACLPACRLSHVVLDGARRHAPCFGVVPPRLSPRMRDRTGGVESPRVSVACAAP